MDKIGKDFHLTFASCPFRWSTKAIASSAKSGEPHETKRSIRADNKRTEFAIRTETNVTIKSPNCIVSRTAAHGSALIEKEQEELYTRRTDGQTDERTSERTQEAKKASVGITSHCYTDRTKRSKVPGIRSTLPMHASDGLQELYGVGAARRGWQWADIYTRTHSR